MRMARNVVAALALGLVLGTTPALAQGGARFYIGGGSTLALGDFNDVANNGPHGVLGLGFVPAGFPVGIRIDGRYHRISTEADDIDTQIIDGTANAVFSFSVAPETRFRPYLIGGLGIYNSKSVGDDDLVGDLDDSSTDFGVNAGAGFDIFLKENLGIFLEGRFHNIFVGDDEPDDDIDAGDVQFIPISLGVRIGR